MHSRVFMCQLSEFLPIFSPLFPQLPSIVVLLQAKGTGPPLVIPQIPDPHCVVQRCFSGRICTEREETRYKKRHQETTKGVTRVELRRLECRLEVRGCRGMSEVEISFTVLR